ncbi:MAG: ATP synthase subunit C [Treponema sp.]|jgi:V/A-type H+-transporting ATPase subunit K|nr:ATP synthase subunit C [Treponema sp.]
MKRVLLAAFLFLCIASGTLLLAQEAVAEGQTVEAASGGTSIWKYFAAALAVGISCIAGGIAVGQIGAAAMGAMSENPELSGKALPYAGLAEGICLWGFLVALLILIF